MEPPAWHSIQMEVPEKMTAMNKHGKVSIRNTLTPQGSLSRSNKQPSIHLIPKKIKPDDVHRDLEYQKEKLRLKLDDLKRRSGDNEQLVSVLHDYESVYEHMKQQDATHAQQLEFILRYIEDIKETQGLTDAGLETIQLEHDKLLGKMHEIKSKISSIV
jgi:hypothetical protein